MSSLLSLLHDVGSIAHIVFIISVVAALGLAMGSLKYRGIGLGIAGVLFAGLIVGHFVGKNQLSRELDLREQIKSAPVGSDQAAAASEHLTELEKAIEGRKHIFEFAREFGLILFVYAIGMQVGPGFVASLRKQGLPLNIMAGSIVILGAVITVGIIKLTNVGAPVAVGLFSGGTTNTPSLAAAQQALKSVGASEDVRKLPSLGYAVAYPFGIIGIIVAMLGVRFAFRVDPQKESEAIAAMKKTTETPVARLNIRITNPNLKGVPLRRVPGLRDNGVVISRILKKDEIHLAQPDTVLDLGDVVLAVGSPERLEELRLVLGENSDADLREMPTNITSRRVIVTRSGALGKTVEQLEMRQRFGVSVTRITRSEVDIPAGGVRIIFGDNLLIVGEPEGIAAAARELGDSTKQLNHPQVIPVFVGIALGVLLGTLSFTIPGMSAPVKLGLAGGPLVVAIILSRLGHFGPLVWYMPLSANFILREVGIVLFLASVGLMSGDKFLATLQGPGLTWMALAAIITLVPLLAVGFIARAVYKLNYLSICGLLAGSMTDPPALAFAGAITGSEAPSVSYATVYPLVMLLRVLSAQAIVLLFLNG